MTGLLIHLWIYILRSCHRADFYFLVRLFTWRSIFHSVYIKRLKKLFELKEALVKSKVTFEINNLYYFSGKTPWKLYNYTDRFSKKEASFRVFERFSSERRKDVSFSAFIWPRSHDQLSNNYRIILTHKKFIFMMRITKSFIKAWLLVVWTQFTALPPAEQMMSSYITSLSKREYPYDRSICNWSCMLVCNCIAATWTN